MQMSIQASIPCLQKKFLKEQEINSTFVSIIFFPLSLTLSVPSSSCLSTSGRTRPRISAQFFNNDQCRQHGAVIGPGGEIGQPVRSRLRALQMGGGGPIEGGIGEPDMGMPGGPEEGGPEDGGPDEGGPEDGGPEEGGPEDGPEEPAPGHWAPPEGDESEIMDLDDQEDLCVSSAAALLGPTTLDASITAFSSVTIGTYFDFVANSLDGNSFSDSSTYVSSSSLSEAETISLADAIFGLVIWAFGGLAFGLTIFFLFAMLSGMDLFPNLVDSYPTETRGGARGRNSFMTEAENDILTDSKHSSHGLLNQDSRL
jgi:hypothetical protein